METMIDDGEVGRVAKKLVEFFESEKVTPTIACAAMTVILKAMKSKGLEVWDVIPLNETDN
jgi:hypothetical protein